VSDKIPAYVGLQRLAEELDMSEKTIRRRMADSNFPQPKPGGKWKWKEVEKWMDGGCVAAVASTADQQIKEIQDAAAALEATHH
jgi:predicted DNA-binding transcriptional regulator AlpA